MTVEFVGVGPLMADTPELPLLALDDPKSDGEDEPPAADPGVQAPAGWSNGVDTRILRSPTTLWPWRTISQFRLETGDWGLLGAKAPGDDMMAFGALVAGRP